MCGRSEIKGLLFLSAIVVGSLAAPMNSLKRDVKRSAEMTETGIAGQDKDLQDLMSLVNNQAKQDNTMVHKHKMTHIETHNGETHRVKETEEKVIDSKTGDVIADVTQEVKQSTSGGEGDAPPETVVETKVDIPSEGVHERIVQDSEEEEKDGESELSEEEAIPKGPVEEVADDMTPVDMAEFLMATGQFDLFYTALDKLVNQSKMTKSDALEYARVVALEYQRLELLAEGEGVERRSQGPPYLNGYPGLQVEEYPSYPVPQPEEYISPEEKYLRFLQQQQLEQDRLLLQQQQQQQQQHLDGEIQGDLNPYDFLTALWEEAFDKGNGEAQAIVQMLYDRVNSDDNQDDMGQISDILVDTVASAFPYQDSPLEDQDLSPSLQDSGLDQVKRQDSENHSQTVEEDNSAVTEDEADDDSHNEDDKSDDKGDEQRGEDEGEKESESDDAAEKTDAENPAN